MAHGAELAAADGTEGLAARELAPHERAAIPQLVKWRQRRLRRAANHVGVDKPEGASALRLLGLHQLRGRRLGLRLAQRGHILSSCGR